MCKVVQWELKISRLAKNTEQEDWTPSGDDERDNKNLSFHTHARTIVQRGKAHIQEPWDLKSPWWYAEFKYQFIYVAEQVEVPGGFDCMHQQEA